MFPLRKCLHRPSRSKASWRPGRQLYIERLENRVVLSTNGVVPISGSGDVYFQKFDAALSIEDDGFNVGGLGNDGGLIGPDVLLPKGWIAITNAQENTFITRPFPTGIVVTGTYNAGDGASNDRTLAVGNIGGTEETQLQFFSNVVNDDVRAIRLTFDVEAWGADPIWSDNPGEAVFDVSLDVDTGNGFEQLIHFGETTTGARVTPPGPSSVSAVIDGNEPSNRVSFDSGVVETSIPLGGTMRLVFDAQNRGATSGYLFGLDNVTIRTLAAGDADGDGDVDFDDKVIVAGNLNLVTENASWRQGDFDQDADVDSGDASVFSARTIDLDLTNLDTLREKSLRLAIGEDAQRFFGQAEDMFQRALVLAGEGRSAEGGIFVSEAESAYMDAILAGLEQGLFLDAEEELQCDEPVITVEQFERAQGLFSFAQQDDLTPSVFSKLIDSIEEDLKLVFVAGPGSPLPDLTVRLWNVPDSSIRWTHPFPPVANEPAEVRVLLENLGPGQVEDTFDTLLYVDGQLARTWTFSTDQLEGGPLLPDSSLILGHDVMFSGGTHTFRWVVDVGNDIHETDESKQSNELEESIAWQSALDIPDLVVEDITHDGELVVGEEITWRVTIKNAGQLDVTQSFITTLKANAVQIGAWSLASLSAGQSRTFESTQTVTDAGTDMLTALVDAGNVVRETNDENNVLHKQFTSAYVDIQVTNLRIEPTEPVVHEPIRIKFDVTNTGPGTVTKPFAVWVMPGQVRNGLTQPILLNVSADRLPIRPGDSIPFTHEVQLAYSGDYLAGIQADFPNPAFVYRELDKINNVATRRFHLKETYHIAIADVSRNACGTVNTIRLDRSGGNWKGDVEIQFTVDKSVRIPARQSSISVDIANISEGRREDRSVEFFADLIAIDGTRSINTGKTSFTFSQWGPVNIRDIDPGKGAIGTVVPVLIKGEHLRGHDGSAPRVTLTNRDRVNVTVNSSADDQIRANIDLTKETSPWFRSVQVKALCRKPDSIRFATIPGVTQTGVEPDLQPLEGWIEPTSFPNVNQAFTFYFLVLNRHRTRGVGSFNVDLQLVDLEGSAKSQSIRIPFSPLGPAQKAQGHWRPKPLPAGRYAIDVSVDPDMKINEFDEFNNVLRAINFRVSQLPPPKGRNGAAQ